MITTFKDIKISALSDLISRDKDTNSALRDIVLTLSASVPSEWAAYFNKLWKLHIYMMKRQAYVSGENLMITCVPEELEKIHLPELKNVIAQTNQEYRRYFEKKTATQATLAAKEKADAEKLTDMKKNIKFDL